MGNPDTGEIYEGALRDAGDVPLTEAQADLMRSLPLSERIDQLQDLKKQITNEGQPAEQAEPEPHDAPEFVRLVMQAVTMRKIKPRCFGCDCVGWANFTLHHVPVVTPTMAQGEVMLSACFICLKCGAMTYRNLNVLGLRIEQQEKRVITPDQMRQQPMPLVMP